MPAARINVITVIFIVACNNMLASGSIQQGPLYAETALLTTDRQIFLPGDNIEFSVIILEADSYKTSLLSRIVKLELFDSSGTAVSRGEFILDQGKVSSSLTVPSGSAGGWYYLRAYTNWMRNSPELLNCFLPLKVINPADLESAIPSGTPVCSSVTLTPESGRLAEGENSCAVFARERSGEGMSVDGSLISVEGDTIARISTDQTGYGLVSFTHSPGREYTISLQGSPELVIDERVPAGTEFQYSYNRNSISIAATGLPVEIVQVILHRNYTSFYQESVATDAGRMSVRIPIWGMQGGIYQVSLLSENNEILFSRLLINGDPVSEDIQTGFNISRQDEKSIFWQFNTEDRFTSDLSIVSNLITRDCPFDTYSYYIPGLPGWPAGNEIPAEEEARQGWLIASSYPASVTKSFFRDGLFGWNEPVYDQLSIMDDREKQYRFLPETRGFVLSGRFIDEAGNPLQNSSISAIKLSDNELIGGYTFNSGRFHLNIPPVGGEQDFMIAPTSEPEAGSQIIPDGRFDEGNIIIPNRRYALSDDEITYARESYLNIQLKEIYAGPGSDSAGVTIDKPVKESIFGIPSFRISIDKYIKLTNIREVIFEVVPRVSVRSNKGRYTLKVISDPPLPEMYDPLFLLDGIPFYDLNDLLALPPDRMKTIEVVDRLFIHGNSIFSGIVSFTSVNDDLAGLSLPAVSSVVSYDMPAEGNLQLYDSNGSEGHIPVLDATLLWKAFAVESRGELAFSLNDNPMKIVGITRGFNSQGQWIYSKKSLTFAGEIP